MSFMQRQITVKRKWYEIETDRGIWFVDVDDVDRGKFADALAAGLELDTWALKTLESDYLQYTDGSRIVGLSVRDGFGARLSAPGYTDCTEWAVFDTKEEAEAYLEEMYGDDEDENSDEEVSE